MNLNASVRNVRTRDAGTAPRSWFPRHHRAAHGRRAPPPRSAFGNHRPSNGPQDSAQQMSRMRRVLPQYGDDDDDAAAGEEAEAALADMAAGNDDYAASLVARTGARGGGAASTRRSTDGEATSYDSFDDFVDQVQDGTEKGKGEARAEKDEKKVLDKEKEKEREKVHAKEKAKAQETEGEGERGGARNGSVDGGDTAGRGDKGEKREKREIKPAAPREESLQRSMTAVFQPARQEGREYRPRSALSLARRRMINKYLPYEWQASLRRYAESIPEQSFNYLLSSLVLIATAVASGLVAYAAFPVLRSVIIYIFQADPPEARVLQELTYETQYLAAISLVTAILLGNTFGFAFDRQRQIIQEISNEVFALELLLQEAFLELPEPHLRWRVIKHVRRYVEHEIQARNIDSPFRVEGAIVGLFEALITLKQENKRISRMLSAVEMLAQANSRRGALAAALLPPLHWVLLASLCGMLLIAFILFDSDFPNNVAENRMIFTVLSATLVSILQVLQDISAPDDGLYSVRDAMENRLTYVRWQMDNILNDPAIKVSILGGAGNPDEGEAPEDDVDDGEEGGRQADSQSGGGEKAKKGSRRVEKSTA